MAAKHPGYTELRDGESLPEELAQRVMAGEVFVIRRCMQRIGLLEQLRAASLEGIRGVVGDDIADKVDRAGFDQIHNFVDLEKLAAITDEIYRIAGKKASGWVAKIMPEVLGVKKPYYFERKPNIRFVIPYDLMVKHADFVARFTKRHGGGKITPHPPHRDSWVDCPANTINVWTALGPVSAGNGISIFPDSFKRDVARVPTGGIASDESPGQPVTFDLAPGDVLLFQGDHLHASVLNRTDATRHALSLRVVIERPHYIDKHYHHYAYSSLAGGPLDVLSELPANLTWGWLKTRLFWVAQRLGLIEMAVQGHRSARRIGTRLGGERTFELSRLSADSLRPVSEDICVARIGDGKLVAFGRRCPHGNWLPGLTLHTEHF